MLDQRQCKCGHKPAFTESNQQARIKHAEWGLERVETDIFIYTDEIMWSFGEHRWHASKIILDISADANVHTCKKLSWQKDSWMLSAAICERYAPKYYIWDEPSAVEIARNDAEHNGYIQVAKDCQKQDQQVTKQLGTQQFQEHKAAIQAVCTKQQAEKKIIRAPSIQQIFKKE